MVTVGIDAHKSSLAVSLVDELGRELAHDEFANDAAAHRELYAWVVRLAPGERRFGIESTGWLKLLCAYRCQLVAERNRVANRLHVDLVSLRPGYERQIRTLDSGVRLDRAEQVLAGEESVQAGLARRRIEKLRRLDAEIKQLGREITAQVTALGSGLPQLVGLGYLSAARIIGEVGDIRRITSKARFARMNGTAPIPASSGQTSRHRLNKGGNRRLNHALHMMALTQARMDPRARAYVERRRAEGKTRRDAVRALKRHLSDVVYQQLRRDALLCTVAGAD